MTYEYDLHESKEAGRAEGIAETKKELAVKMLDYGDSFEKISSITGIPEEDIRRLASITAK